MTAQTQDDAPLAEAPQVRQAPVATADNILDGKRVLFVVNADAGGGVEQLVSTLAPYLSEQGAHVETCWLYPKTSIGSLSKLRGILKAAKTVSCYRADILVTFQPTSSVIATVAARLTGCRTRVVHQSNMPQDTHPIPRALDWLAGSLGFYSTIIINSRATNQAFGGYPRSYVRRFRVIPHGVTYGAPKVDREAMREAVGVPDGARIMLVASRLTPVKSVGTIISALPQVPDAHLLIAGGGESRDALQKLSAKLGVTDRVTFLGIIPAPKLPDYYAIADLFASASKSETFGLATVEAATHGIPVVASTIPATREVLTLDGESPAVFVDGWDTANWAKGLTQALDDKDVIARAKEFAPKFREWYSNSRMLKTYEELFREVLS